MIRIYVHIQDDSSGSISQVAREEDFATEVIIVDKDCRLINPCHSTECYSVNVNLPTLGLLRIKRCFHFVRHLLCHFVSLSFILLVTGIDLTQTETNKNYAGYRNK